MSSLVWTDSLSAPRSLATRGETGVAVIEDPGIVEICLGAYDKKAADRCAKILGSPLPQVPWETVLAQDVRIAWVGMRRWRIIGDRDLVSDLCGEMAKKAGRSTIFDLTGAYACFRIVGATANEILMRVCPLNLGGVAKDYARGTSIAGVQSLLVREAQNSWLVLTSRSYGEHVAHALIEAARSPGRLGLFEPRKPPPV